jgi:hypothetical protein
MSRSTGSNPYLPLYVEQKLRQIILKDLISDKTGFLYKQHTEAMLEQAQTIIQEKKLEKTVAKQLLLAAYGYHWGCCNLHDQPGHSHQDLLAHKDVCYKLSAIKLERFFIYNFPKVFTQGKLLEVVDSIEVQSKETLPVGSLASLLRSVAISAEV